MEKDEAILQGILATIARQVFPPDVLTKLITVQAGNDKQKLAYNLCDGKTSQAEIGKAANVDKGSLSRTISRWVELGIVIRIGREQYPLHVYPLPKEYIKSASKE